MEKKLRKLFDYQVFAQNKHLDEVIRSADDERLVNLNDDVLFAVAGGNEQNSCPKELSNMKTNCINCIYCKQSLTNENIYHCDILNENCTINLKMTKTDV